MTINGDLNCSDQEMLMAARKMSRFKMLMSKFKMLMAARKMSSRLQERDDGLFRETGGGTPWEAALKGKGAQKSWQLVFKDNLFKS